jgi:hypothetical protein
LRVCKSHPIINMLGSFLRQPRSIALNQVYSTRRSRRRYLINVLIAEAL